MTILNCGNVLNSIMKVRFKLKNNLGVDVMRGSDIKGTYYHDAGAYGKCSKCGVYSDDQDCLIDDYICPSCGGINSFCGSFVKPTKKSKWVSIEEESPYIFPLLGKP